MSMKAPVAAIGPNEATWFGCGAVSRRAVPVYATSTLSPDDAGVAKASRTVRPTTVGIPANGAVVPLTVIVKSL